jgi:peptidoglycan-N-acetylglucosamine deacetylase
MLQFTTPKLAHWLFPQLIWQVPNQGNKIYLTFDDGPVPGPTEEVLEILDQHQVKATFFCVGHNVHKYPDIFLKVLENAHQVGNHTFHHLKGWKTNKQQYLKDVNACKQVMEEVANKSFSLFRPPYGKITLAQIKLLQDYHIIMWNLLARDFDSNVSAQKSLLKLKKHTRKGSIIVFHDSLKTISRVKKCLPAYIKYCKDLGYQFDLL